MSSPVLLAAAGAGPWALLVGGCILVAVAIRRLRQDSKRSAEAPLAPPEPQEAAPASHLPTLQERAERAEARRKSEQALALWIEAGEHGRAAELLEREQRPARAAAMYRMAGDYEAAIRCYRQAGDEGRAADVARELEEAAVEARRHACKLRNTGSEADSADILISLGDVDQGARSLARAGQYEEALRVWQGAGQHDKAARLLLRLGRVDEAAASFELAEAWELAARCYEQLGAHVARARCLARGGHLARAARVAIGNGEVVQAVEILALIPPEDVNYPKACQLLEGLHTDLGEPVEAGRALARGLAGAEPTPERRPRFVKLADFYMTQGELEEALRSLRLLDDAGLGGPDVSSRLERIHRTLLDHDGTSLADAADALLPEPAERYTLTLRLGRGRLGEVFQATDGLLEQEVALKLCHRHLVPDDRVRAALQRAVQPLCGLEHPAIGRVFDVHIDCVRPCVGTELSIGESLAEVLDRDGPLALDALVKLLGPIARGLDYAHDHRVLHHSIKPGNIMITDAGAPKLLDFALAGVLAKGQQMTIAVSTRAYLSPEQILGEPLTGRSDLYALACVAYHCLSGRPPFYTGDILADHVHAPPPAIREARPELPLSVEEALQRGLAKTPGQRFSTAEELVAALARGCTSH